MGSLMDLSSALANGEVLHALQSFDTHENKVERLPFSIRFASSEEDILKAVSVRQSAYARHVPHLAAQLSRPEPMDSDPEVSLMLVESKLDGRTLGTMRLQTNRSGPLALEGSITLPDKFQGVGLSEATRLGVVQDKIGRIVTTMLFKAYYMYCLNNGIEWMVITARSPMDKRYDSLLFEDVYPGRGYIPMRHVGDIPHRVMALNVALVRERWARIGHPLYNLIFLTNHPDIDVDQADRLPKFLHDFQCANSYWERRSHS